MSNFALPSLNRLPSKMNILCRKSKWCWWLLSLTLLAVGYASFVSWMLVPSLNPDPKNKVTLEGDFPYSKGLQVNAFLRVYSTTRICESSNLVGRLFVSNRVQPSPASYDIPLEVTPLEGDHYRLTYFTDVTRSGICGWQLLDALLVSIHERSANGRPRLFIVSQSHLSEEVPLDVKVWLRNGHAVRQGNVTWNVPLAAQPPVNAVVNYYIGN